MSGTTMPRVLVVDDDESVLVTVAKLLQAERFSADLALSGPDALARLREAAYDAVVCDMWMPGMTGKEFYEQVEKEFPGFQKRIVFLTGDLASAATWDFIEGRHLPYIFKPFNLPDFRRKIREVISGHAGPIEKRRHRRLMMRAAVRVRRKKWASGEPEIIPLGNACREGVYFVTDRQYYVGTEVLVCFPYTGADDYEQEGCVVRVEPSSDGRSGVAIALGAAAARVRSLASPPVTSLADST